LILFYETSAIVGLLAPCIFKLIKETSLDVLDIPDEAICGPLDCA
jgi:hypothetical protein